MAENPLVSVLVPIYNVQKFLPQCLDALTNQTLRDIEIIAVNDGSTDESPRIIADNAARDQRIRVIDKPNSGYGASLNMGLEQARGTYVGIAEPDDFTERSMYKKLSDAARKYDADLVKCNFFETFEDHEQANFNLREFAYKKPFDPADQPKVVHVIPSIWAALYRREWLNDQGIRFRETPGASFQDTGFTMKAWFGARRAVFVKKPLLHYRMDNPNSSSKSTAKVFEVCDELQSAQEYLRTMPERYQKFICWFHVDKWGKYQWNYERIASELHAEFVERARSEYQAAQAAAELDMSLFTPREAQQVHDLLALEPAQFADKYETLYY